MPSPTAGFKLLGDWRAEMPSTRTECVSLMFPRPSNNPVRWPTPVSSFRTCCNGVHAESDHPLTGVKVWACSCLGTKLFLPGSGLSSPPLVEEVPETPEGRRTRELESDSSTSCMGRESGVITSEVSLSTAFSTSELVLSPRNALYIGLTSSSDLKSSAFAAACNSWLAEKSILFTSQAAVWLGSRVKLTSVSRQGWTLSSDESLSCSPFCCMLLLSADNTSFTFDLSSTSALKSDSDNVRRPRISWNTNSEQ